jgi:DNA-binding transcriptional regulator GbsR (MarR family)
MPTCETIERYIQTSKEGLSYILREIKDYPPNQNGVREEDIEEIANTIKQIQDVLKKGYNLNDY